jgi:hypothetical protein
MYIQVTVWIVNKDVYVEQVRTGYTSKMYGYNFKW